MSQMKDHQVHLSEGSFRHSPQLIGEKLLVFNRKKGSSSRDSLMFIDAIALKNIPQKVICRS